jgi:hypothetical protein
MSIKKKLGFPILALTIASVLASYSVAKMSKDKYSTHAMVAVKGAVLDDNSETSIPEGFRLWSFIGAPLTPNGLNDGAAGFPEFHHVYIQPDALQEYLETGVFPEGTTIVKELVLLQEGEYEDGSRDEPSGRGFFADRFAGIDMMVKDSVRFAETNGWGFFNFGHHEPPYAKVAKPASADACAGCHIANADLEMVFGRMYPILKRK